MFAGPSSHCAALPVRSKATNTHQTEMLQSTMFTSLEMLFSMKKAFSVHEQKFFFRKLVLGSPVQEG